MSLTSVLAREDHPVARWFSSSLGHTAAVRASHASTFPVRRVQRPVAAGRTVVRWDLLGIAVDFRLRCAFAPPQVPPSAAAGVRRTGAIGGRWQHRAGESLISAFEEHLRNCQPHVRGRGWLLGPQDENRLDRICFALAWFDRVYRNGVIASDSPLAHLTAEDADGLLAKVPDYAVGDLQVQLRLAQRALGELRDATEATACRAAPTFAGSADVGGADADLIVGRCLIDIKSVTRPGHLSDKVIWQLAGYALLDYRDEYDIAEVGFYLSRVGWLVSWPINEFFRMLGSRVPLDQLRSEFAYRCATARPPVSQGFEDAEGREPAAPARPRPAVNGDDEEAIA